MSLTRFKKNYLYIFILIIRYYLLNFFLLLTLFLIQILFYKFEREDQLISNFRPLNIFEAKSNNRWQTTASAISSRDEISYMDMAAKIWIFFWKIQISIFKMKSENLNSFLCVTYAYLLCGRYLNKNHPPATRAT
jgi:hypothetical protein